MFSPILWKFSPLCVLRSILVIIRWSCFLLHCKKQLPCPFFPYPLPCVRFSESGADCPRLLAYPLPVGVWPLCGFVRGLKSRYDHQVLCDISHKDGVGCLAQETGTVGGASVVCIIWFRSVCYRAMLGYCAVAVGLGKTIRRLEDKCGVLALKLARLM